jgi:glycosyltransferase involved in cell wall biosynthesis
MHLYIDSSNILAGGGKTHLVELLQHVSPHQYGFEKVTLYGHKHVLDSISNKDWLTKITPSLFNYGYKGRLLWQFFFRPQPANGIWFVPGAGQAPAPYVTMCQNLLPLEINERDRYFFSFTWLRLVMLRMLHLKAFKNATGVVFLNQYCFNVLPQSIQKRIKKKAIIPHGVSQLFTPQPTQSFQGVFKLIYVSTVDEYKHQWKIAQAIAELINEGYQVEIDFIGGANPVSLKRLNPFLSGAIRYRGVVPYGELPAWYSRSDAFIFGSTCETFGMVLLEAMACGLPVICSNKSSMPETVGDCGLYFDPLEVKSIKEAISKIYKNQPLMEELRLKGINYAKQFSWERISHETFKFIQECSLR